MLRDDRGPGAYRDPADKTDYRCRKCDSIVPRGTHHRMTSCTCGAVQVDRGWYGTRILWSGGKREDVVEEIAVS